MAVESLCCLQWSRRYITQGLRTCRGRRRYSRHRGARPACAASTSVFDSRSEGGESPAKPVLTVVALVGAFIALGVLLTVLSAIAALGGGGALLAICGVPVMLIALIVWLVTQKPGQPKTQPVADPMTIDGTAAEARQAPSGETRTTGAESASRGWTAPLPPREHASPPVPGDRRRGLRDRYGRIRA